MNEDHKTLLGAIRYTHGLYLRTDLRSAASLGWINGYMDALLNTAHAFQWDDVLAAAEREFPQAIRQWQLRKEWYLR